MWIIFWWRVAKWRPASSAFFRKLGDVETHPPLKRHRPQPVGATKRPVGRPKKHFRVELTDALEDLSGAGPSSTTTGTFCPSSSSVASANQPQKGSRAPGNRGSGTQITSL